MFMRIFILISLILFTALTGCERVSEMVQPDTPTPPTDATLKIGVIQSSHSYTTFSQGAETARVQINEKGGVLGMQGRVYHTGQSTRSRPKFQQRRQASVLQKISLRWKTFLLYSVLFDLPWLLPSVPSRSRHSASCSRVPVVQTSLKLEIIFFSLRCRTHFKGK